VDGAEQSGVVGDLVVVQIECIDLKGLGELAQRFAAALREGDLVLLEGPLGAGKTTFVRMLCHELGVTDQVRSPSFTIANVYEGPVPVNHLDLYRLEGTDDEDVLALEDYVGPSVITMVEWPDAGRGLLGRPTWVVALEHRDLETRGLRIEAMVPEAARRWEQARER